LNHQITRRVCTNMRRVYQYEAHYRLGTPDATPPQDTPEAIPKDYSEALKCRSVDALGATVIMCGRALEASCNEVGATGKRLPDKIDSLGDQGKITPSSREMAHHIKVARNLRAHPQENETLEVGREDADEAIESTRIFFQCVYTLPAPD
jgi:hypothetical protein